MLHLLRMAKWARNPPSPARVKLVLAVVALCAGLYLVERYVGWPEALSLNPENRSRMLR